MENFTYSLSGQYKDNLNTLNKTTEQDYRDHIKEAQMQEFKKYLDMFDNTPNGASAQDINDYTCYQQSVQMAGQILIQYFQIQAILKVPEKDRPYELDMALSNCISKEQQHTPNIFEDLIGPGWSAKFDKCIISNTNSAISIGLRHLEYEIDSSNLPDNKKKLAHEFIAVTKEAFFIDTNSKRFNNMITKTSGVLKIYNNTTRLDRSIATIDEGLKHLRIYNLNANYVPIFFTGLIISFNWRYKVEALASKIFVKEESQKKKKSKNDISGQQRMFVVGVLFGIILAEYIKNLRSDDYLSFWYAAMLIKFMEMASFVPTHQQASEPQLRKSVSMFLDTIDILISKYCIVYPVVEQLREMPLEVQEIDLQVPTKEEWELLKLPPEEQERILTEREAKARELIENDEKKIKDNSIIDLSLDSNTQLVTKPISEKQEDYITLGTGDMQLTLTLPNLKEEEL